MKPEKEKAVLQSFGEAICQPLVDILFKGLSVHADDCAWLDFRDCDCRIKPGSFDELGQWQIYTDPPS